MNDRKKHIQNIVERHLALFNSPPETEMELAQERLLQRFRAEHVDTKEKVDHKPAPQNTRWRPFALAVSAAAILVLVVLAQNPAIRSRIWTINANAVVEAADDGLFSISSGQAIRAGARIEAGAGVRTNDGLGAVLALADGSHIEMRSQSELFLERSEDGVRIRLTKGGVIINAARQRTGHLYVQTRDVSVSVIGTVFLVNAEEAGSRVAVIQGEVQVQQGATSKKLLPGEQVASNPLMQPHPVREEIAWSRNAETHLGLLPQSSQAATRLEFEAASLKPGEPIPNRRPTRVLCRGVDGVLDAAAPASNVPLGRCTAGNVTLLELVATAYDIPTRRISGLPAVIDQPTYQIEAKAENPSGATKEELRQMLQKLAVDRLQLKVHREEKETSGYVLVVGKAGIKFTETSGDEDNFFVRTLGPPSASGEVPGVLKGKFRLKRFTEFVSTNVGLPAIDRTGLAGLYDITLMLNLILPAPPADAAPGAPGGRGGGNSGPPAMQFDPPFAKALEDQLGLRLESGRVPVEYVVVDHVEKPSEN